MTKKTVSIILAITLVVCLFAGVNATASAAVTYSATNYNAVIDALNVEGAKAGKMPLTSKISRTEYSYAAHDGTTFCNYFAQDVLHNMGLRDDVDYLRTGTPSAMITWFDNYIKNGKATSESGWVKVDAATAQKYANKGYPTVALQDSTASAGQHAAIVRPEKGGYAYSQSAGPVIAQAGSVCANYTYVSKTFGDGWAKNVKYYSYHPHEYSDVGACKICGYKYKFVEATIDLTAYVINATSEKAEPYAAATNKITHKVFYEVKFVAKVQNAFGNTWYKTSKGGWLYGSSVIIAEKASGTLTLKSINVPIKIAPFILASGINYCPTNTKQNYYEKIKDAQGVVWYHISSGWVSSKDIK
jgi:hypothetical protein